jgi:GNAT superfamily N-acetyltransferase/peptidase E
MKRIYLLGGEDINKRDSIDIIKRAFADAGGSPNVLIFPWTDEIEKIEYRKIMSDYFRELNAARVKFAELSDSIEEINEKVERSDLIYFPGGFPELLVERMRDKELERILRKYDRIIICNSAGALALCKEYVIIKGQHDAQQTRIEPGIGLVDFGISVHYKSPNEEYSGLSPDVELRKMSDKMELKIYAIPEKAAIIHEGERLEFIGDVRLFFKGEVINDNDVAIVRFTADLIEEYLDLVELDDSTDPLYGEEISRSVVKARTLSRLQLNLLPAESEFLAIQKGRAVGHARAAVIPTCGELAQRIATLTMTIAPSRRGLGIGSRLLDEICKDIGAQGVDWIEIAISNDWKDWQRFLKKHGFAIVQRFYDVVLKDDAPLKEKPIAQNANMRPVRFPEDRERVLDLYNKERAEDLPKACAILPGQPAWWEMEPWSSHFDPETFLVAEDKNTRELIGYVSAVVMSKDNPWGLIDYLDVEKEQIATPLGESLLVQVIDALRKKGASDIRTRIHIGYRNEEELFRRNGFEIEDSYAVWRRETV